MKDKIIALAKLVQDEQIERLKAQQLDCAANVEQAKTSVTEGKKYTRIDIGSRGSLMVENSTGNIFGIKGYGQVHKGHFYGTLDTINDYFWGDYYPKHKTAPTATQGASSIPKLTFAPQPVVAV